MTCFIGKVNSQWSPRAPTHLALTSSFRAVASFPSIQHRAWAFSLRAPYLWAPTSAQGTSYRLNLHKGSLCFPLL